jgi:hypothetical protein
MKMLVWVTAAILALSVAAYAEQYDQDLLDAVKAGTMTLGAAQAEQERRDAERTSVKAIQLISDAGEESGYWPCLRGIIGPWLPAPTDTNQKVFKAKAMDDLITDAQIECDSRWPAFVTAAARKGKAAGLSDDISRNQPAFRKQIHDLWYQELAKVYVDPAS